MNNEPAGRADVATLQAEAIMNDMEMRELDAWIAASVLGIKETSEPDKWTDTDEDIFWHRNELNRATARAVFIGKAYLQYGETSFSHSWSKFQPTTDPAAAMDVLEKCAIKSGYGLTVIPQSNGMWFACSNYANEAFGETLNIAICLLAKKLFTK